MIRKKNVTYEEINKLKKNANLKPEEMVMTSCAAYGEITTSKAMMEDKCQPGDYETIAVASLCQLFFFCFLKHLRKKIK